MQEGKEGKKEAWAVAYARQQEAWAVLCTADAEEAWRKPGRERRRESEAKPANSQKKKPGNF